MKSIWLVAALVASLVLNVAAIGAFVYLRLARQRPRFALLKEMRPEHRREILALRNEFESRVDSLRRELDQAQHELAMLLRPEADPTKAGVLIDRIGAIHGELTRTAFDYTRLMGERLPPKAQERLFRGFERHYGRPEPPRPGPRWRRPGPRPQRFHGRGR